MPGSTGGAFGDALRDLRGGERGGDGAAKDGTVGGVPILFSAPMIRALLAGTKTQTRRIMKPQPVHAQRHEWKNRVLYDAEHRLWWWKDRSFENLIDFDDGRRELAALCPYGVPGGRLWVKETWQATSWFRDWESGYYEFDSYAEKIPKEKGRWSICFAADDGWEDREDRGFPWRPSIFMPRWASRIDLEVTEVRVERLQDISEVDAIAEGVDDLDVDVASVNGEPATGFVLDPRQKYAALWDAINGAQSWSENPFVWAVSFRRVKP